MTERLDCAVIGGGVVGLAIARKLALLGRQVVLFEAERATGLHTSSRNSEVLHAGIYYPTGSLKARLCVEGRRLLESYCQSHGITWRRIGKIVVAVQRGGNSEARTLQGPGPHQRRRRSGVARTRAGARARTVGVLRARLGLAVDRAHRQSRPDAGAGPIRANAGGDIVLGSPVKGGELADDGMRASISTSAAAIRAASAFARW
jgi:glycine/D-amino acid oxidase-like deaminating enzyme